MVDKPYRCILDTFCMHSGMEVAHKMMECSRASESVERCVDEKMTTDKSGSEINGQLARVVSTVANQETVYGECVVSMQDGSLREMCLHLDRISTQLNGQPGSSTHHKTESTWSIFHQLLHKIVSPSDLPCNSSRAIDVVACMPWLLML